MSRALWCSECGGRQDKRAGTRCIYEARPGAEDDPPEPAEYERVTWGRARWPNPDLKPISLEFYLCDGCNARINPGDRAMGWTIWREDMPEPRAWEIQYLELT